MTLDDRLKRAVDSLGDKLRDEIAKELTSLSLAEPRDEAKLSRLADAMRAIDHARSLSEILETLATAASNEAARAGVFLMNGESLRGFRLFGFPAQLEGAPVELQLSRAGVLADAIRQRSVATAASGPFDDLAPGVKAVAVPLVLAGASVGALYVEGADVAAVEILTRFASRALEAQTAMKAARAFADTQAI
jgi:hypothetical protein